LRARIPSDVSAGASPGPDAEAARHGDARRGDARRGDSRREPSHGGSSEGASASGLYGGRDETPLERLDRNLEELTGELRVVVTGVQVLFAFLLIVPFDSGFAHVGDFERAVYFVTLLLATLAATCMIAPSARHRFLFRHDDKQRIVFVSNRVVIAGLGFLALAMCGCVLLVTSTLFGVFAGLLTAIFAGVPFAALWFAMPLLRRRELNARRSAGRRPRGR
jgi:Family of unknown function (DUF6328)